VTGTVPDVGSQARLDHLGSAWFGTVATGHSYRPACLAVTLAPGMSAGDGTKRRTYVRRAVVGLAVVASTVAADLAANVEHVDPSRFVVFGVAGVLAAVVVLVTPASQKKMSPELQSG